MNIWAKLLHENIIKLEGFILENGFPAVVSMWEMGGTVVEYVKGHPDCDMIRIVCYLILSC